ncbi:glycosyltransferase family 8 protein [Nostoc sp. FACHB-152]|uniref:glycosyltransferase family 8 protein n=1 Tax=unclassified Nostoc TaxID=2593658 RepID=UPI001686FA19|nr:MULTISPECIES: glycosyltransferase family 8 protein [unclassified Nostoc]MBD2445795.1 glycosyltransferase family 8 protein [Nostoc sp. FACHB-152]MBD2466909.1 glycosyltransferase family 8 protein [Nostoc sp. FACHB-145]
MLTKNCEPVFIVCAADDNYAMPLAVTVRSASENLSNDHRLVVFVIDGGIKKHNKEKILRSLPSDRCEVNFILAPEYLLANLKEAHQYCAKHGITLNTHVSIASYYRLLIPELLPKHIDKVIYLDCDLVVEKNLGELWQVDLGENYLLAVQDMWIGYVSDPRGLLNYKELGIPPNTKYFNAGILFLNLKKWRDNSVTEKALEYTKQNKDYIRFHDQDVLNGMMVGKWGELDPRWNMTPGIYDYPSWRESPFSEEEYNQIIHDPYILHFATLKPWKSRWTRNEFKANFFKYLNLTAWAGWKLTLWRRLGLKISRELQAIFKVLKVKF